MKVSPYDIRYMQRCLELARLGIGNVAPNPMVGSVIVYNNCIIGEGYHKKYGGPHAEVHAIESVADKKLLKESTLYVNLEPCAHYGKTPPCADRIIREGLPKVVIGTSDPYALVAGKGIKKMQETGIVVVNNVLYNECMQLNHRFFTFYSKKRPYIILKWAESANGFMDIDRSKAAYKEPFWISNSISQTLSHKLRSHEQAILVGYNTVVNDNPSLTTRHWPGQSPIRIILDPYNALPLQKKVFDKQALTLVYGKKSGNDLDGTEYVFVENADNPLPLVFADLFARKIQSIIVEGGAQTLQNFINRGFWDEALVFKSEIKIKKGLAAPKLNLRPDSCTKIKNDILFHYKPEFGAKSG